MIAPSDTLQSLVGKLDSHGERVAFAQIGQQLHRELTYERLAADSTQLAAGLLCRGLQAGQSVLLYAPNSPDWVIACMAVLRAGAVPVPVDSQMAGPELEHIVRDCDAHWLFATSDRLPCLEGRAALADVRTVLLDGEPGFENHWRTFCADTPLPEPTTRPEDIAVIFYTSGTSGLPKGVPLTHRNILSNIDALLSRVSVDATDRALLPLPLHHVYPFVVGLLTPLLTGMTLIVPSSLIGQHFLAALREGRPSILFGVPRLYETLTAKPGAG